VAPLIEAGDGSMKKKRIGSVKASGNWRLHPEGANIVVLEWDFTPKKDASA
jgi:hypothetical protein